MLTGAQQPIPNLQMKIFFLDYFLSGQKFSIYNESRQKILFILQKDNLPGFFKQTTNFVGKKIRIYRFGIGCGAR